VSVRKVGRRPSKRPPPPRNGGRAGEGGCEGRQRGLTNALDTVLLPGREERFEMSRWRASARGPQSGRGLSRLDLSTGTGVLGGGCSSHGFEDVLCREEPGRGEGHEVVPTEVVSDSSGRAAAPEGTSQLCLGGTEEALKFVRSRRDARVIEADEEVVPIALGELSQVIYEPPGRGSEAGSGGVGLQSGQQIRQPVLCLSCAAGGIGIVGPWLDRSRDGAEDLDVPRDPSGGAASMPVGLQLLRELVEESRAPFSAARSANSRIFSRRRCRISSGGLSGARPEAREA
jgi:hypothetical protein